jgi:PAS domain S-box-containing protein
MANLFRNAGHPVRDQHITSAEQLEKHLLEEDWDLLLAHSNGPDLDLSQLERVLENCNRTVPIILLSDNTEQDRDVALLHNFADTIPADEVDWLLHACLRELSHMRSINRETSLQADMAELKARHELLMASASDAIAYIADGMHMSVNSSYADIFGYDAEDMNIVTVMDLIADDEQDRFKQFIKAYNKNPEQAQSINVTGVREGGEHIALTLELSHATFEGEDCTQIVASEGGEEQALAGTGDTLLFLKQLKHMVARAKSQHSRGALMCIQPWNFWQTRNNLGLFASGQVFALMGEFIASAVPSGCHTVRLEGDYFFVAVPSATEEQALEMAESLCQSIQEHIFEVNQQTVHCETRIGIVMFDQDSIDSPEKLIDYAFMGLGELAQQGSDKAALIYEPPEEPLDILSDNIDLEALNEAGNISLLYQPIIGLRGDSGEYYEVVVNICNESEEGDTEIDPELIAERAATTSGESQYDQWLLFECIKVLSQQKAQGKATCLVVPLSSQALKDKTLANWLLKTMKDSGIPADKLMVQLPEHAVTNALKLAADFLERLGKYKVCGCISHLGVTPDAIKSIQHLKPRWVKVDPSLALAGQKDKEAADRLKELITQTSTSNSAALVPEVTNAATLASLWQAGASYIQGAYLQMPGPDLDYEFAEIA